MDTFESAWGSLKREFDAARGGAERAARRRLTSELQQNFRRLRHYQNEDGWMGALRDALAAVCSRFAVFTVKEGRLQFGATQGVDVPEGVAIPLGAARAFAEVCESREPVVALASAGEVSEALSSALAAERVHLFPVNNDARTVAIVAAPGDPELDEQAVELVAGMAGTVLERQANRAIHSQIAAAATAPQPLTGQRRLPSWAARPREEQARHIRAQRFARTAVAEMLLAKPAARRAGLKQDNLYLFLQREVDRARERYASQFMKEAPLPDYLHEELVTAAAGGDETKLGAEYPGRLA